MFAEPLQQVDRVFVLHKGRRLVYFGGCDYLRLASDPRVTAAVRDGLESFGLNVSASRKTTGNHSLYQEVEQETAKFFRAERAVLVSNGYLANLAVAQALDLPHVLIDRRSHSSLQDAAQLGGFKSTLFDHRSPSDLARKIHRLKSGAVMTDGLFASSGRIAPLAEYRAALGPRRLLWVDDSHAGGILGAHGRGSVEHCGIDRENLIQTITFSKAFGVYGGAILCSRSIAEAVVENSRIASGNTPLPLPLAHAVLASLRIVRSEPELREHLWRNSSFVRQAAGLPPLHSPIIACCPVPTVAKRLRKALLDAGIFPSFIQYPGGPSAGYLRLAISSEHTEQQLGTLANVLHKVGKDALQCP